MSGTMYSWSAVWPRCLDHLTVRQADHAYMVPEPDQSARLGHHVGHHVSMVVVGLTYSERRPTDRTSCVTHHFAG